MTDAQPAFEGHGSRAYRAYVLFALVVIYTFNFLDRGLIGITQEELRRDLGVDDLQLGLLGGPAFAILYTLLGVPIARYAERANRVTIVAVGAAFWSLATATCGFAGSFVQLLAARVGVGIGEAACVAPSQSVITDYFPARRRATAIGIFSLGIPIGTMVAAIGGGWIVSHYGWRETFWALGAPGLIAALLLKLTVREPPRAGLTADAETPSFGATLKHLASKPSFWHIAAGGALIAFVGYSTAQFLVSYSVRTYGVSIAQAAGALGIVAGGAVAVGTFMGGFLTDRLQGFSRTVACWLPGIGLLIALPLYLFSFTAPNFNAAFYFLLIGAAFHYLYLGPMYAVTQSVVTPRMRATAVALLVLIVNLIGLSLGPPSLGALSDYFASRELASHGLALAACKAPGAHDAACAPAQAHGIRFAMLGVTCLIVWPAIHFFLAARTYGRDRIS